MKHWPVVEVDLAGPAPALPPGAAVVRCLVHWGPRFLGETDVQPGRRSSSAVQADLLDDFRDVVSAMQLVPVVEPVHPASDVTVAVLVQDRTRTRDLDRCLEALAALRPCSSEILVVGAPARGPARRVDVAPGGSPLMAAATACRTPILLLTDERSRCLPGWIDAVRRGFDVPEVAAVTGPVTPGELERSSQVLVDRHLRDRSPERLVPHLRTGAEESGLGRPLGETGASLAVRREELLRLGAPVSRLRGVEIVDLVVRLFAAGHVVLSAPDAVVLRTPARTPGELLAERWRQGIERAALLGTYEALGGHWTAAVADERRRLRRAAARSTAGALRHREWLRLAAVVTELHGGRSARVRSTAETP